MNTLCRDCFRLQPAPEGKRRGKPARCESCSSPRLVRHAELEDLAIAHIDCDAFYASVEKRDRPELRDKPVIIGGAHRGVVAAACYVARLYGVRSAMPMFKALQACPDAVVLRPDMARYRAVGHAIRERMSRLTPLVEPLSIDEAFLDLESAELSTSPAQALAQFAREVEDELALTVSVGLSYNKFLAKIASDLDKPRGFAVIGRQEARAFLADKPVGIIWGVGSSLARRLGRDGITRVRDLWRHDVRTLEARYGTMGERLYRFSRGEDLRQVVSDSPTKSISSETTFDEDIRESEILLRRAWPLCERVAARLERAELAAEGVTVKLKTHDFRLVSRSARLADPTRRADRLYAAARPLIHKEADGRAFRLIGVGAHELVPGELGDPPNLFDSTS